jgi:hypothetical protein
MNWNIFNATEGHIIAPAKKLPSGTAKIGSFDYKGYEELPFFDREYTIEPITYICHLAAGLYY